MNIAVIELALTLVLKYAPALYVAAVELFSKSEPTQAEKDAFTAQLTRLMNPGQYYEPK